jgi:hypothetical protein
MIRRASFLHAGRPDTTKYKHANLSINNAQRMRFDDVRSAKMAVEHARKVGVERWLGAALASPRITQSAALRDMIGRGLAELEALLAQHRVK